MPRISLRHERVRDLVDRTLVPLFLRAETVNALCDLLNQALRTLGLEEIIYPNRLHTIFSDNDEQALNTATIELIERAAAAVPGPVDTVEQGAVSEPMAERVLTRWRSVGSSPTAILEVARDLTLPPAVVRVLLTRSRVLPPMVRGAGLAGSPAFVDLALPARVRLGPDWSFQDTACQRCLEALAQGRGRKIGLILPTGAGKTRVALRIALGFLARHPSTAGVVLWVTHRRNLRTQAHRELQKMLSEGDSDLPADAAALLAQRIEFVMLSELAQRLNDPDHPPLLVIIDEAHHAAAPSYAPVFESPIPVPGLFLTATPNRTDALPIGIDEIAYTITYRELAQRGVIILPEFQDFPVEDFNWSQASLENLADYVVERAAREYMKTLVLAPRLDRVEEFHQALIDRLSEEPNHPLEPEDIGFVHSRGNSLHSDTEEFLATFLAKPRAIIVSAQLLLEGFDDPAINAVVLTYPSSSMIVLMQAAGRCVRYAPCKTSAHVVQARNDALAYHFDHRWLYQEISDYLHPELRDIGYADHEELVGTVRDVLQRHNVNARVQEAILPQLEAVAPGQLCRLLLTGFPYYGPRDQFAEQAPWSAVLDIAATSEPFRLIFNHFCAVGADQPDPTDFLGHHGARFGIRRDFAEGSPWRIYTDMLTAMYFARREVYEDGSRSPQGTSRPFEQHRSTTWLKYLTFHYRPTVPAAMDAFLQDCYNREAILAAYKQVPTAYALVIKVPLPLAGCEARLLDASTAEAFRAIVEQARASLRAVPPAEQFATLAAALARVPACMLPLRILERIERFLPEEASTRYVLPLPADDQPGTPALAQSASDPTAIPSSDTERR